MVVLALSDTIYLVSGRPALAPKRGPVIPLFQVFWRLTRRRLFTSLAARGFSE